MGFGGGRRKLKRTKIVLPVGQKIEVRSEDDGFEGSWYTATIDDSCIQGWCAMYKVKYDHLLAEDESDLLVGHVQVPILGEDNDTDDCSDDCGWVRPLPPPLQFEKWALYYGLCVDVHHQDGWWEGVIFDHADGSEERRIFFPDLGDEMVVAMDALRISQEWNEVTGTWHHRGTWLFLELVEEFEQEQYLPISVKQLWYDVREKEGFNRLQEWTSSSRAIWGPLVLEAICDNLKIVVQNLFQVESLPERTTEKLLGLAGHLRYGNTKSDAVMTKCEFPVPRACKMLDVLSPDGQDAEGMSTGEEITCDLKSDSCDMSKDSTSIRSEAGWLSAVPDFVPGPQFCPEAVTEYASLGRKREDIVADTRKHLLYLKWKIEFKKDSIMRFRYTSPDGKCYHSLRLLCQDLSTSESEILAPLTSDKQTNSQTFNDTSLAPVKKLPSNNDIQLSSQGVASSNYNEMIIEPEYCPQAIEEWLKQESYNKGKKAKRAPMVSRARRHLSALGWTFSYTTRRGHPELKYTAPGGERSFSSLRRACRYSLDKGYSRHVKKKNATKTTSGSEKLKSDYEKSPTIQKRMARKVQMKEKGTAPSLFVSRKPMTSLQKMRCRRRSGSQFKVKKQDRQMQPYLALRSTKRQRQVGAASLSHFSPWTILSWLMDNNVLLPREKAYYRSRNNEHLMAGRVTRNGIKCNCCGKLYSANSFAVHAGGDDSTPASSIFLEDGRSLLECQMQIIREKIKNFLEETMDGPHMNCSKNDNDHVCSVCHYGGELILCDQCPSSFHYSCLGMENIPDGEWFCPSCCCGICGQNEAHEDGNHSADNNSLCCTQCERTFHTGCLNDREVRFSGYTKENWLCSKKCESVFLGLNNLLGKQISLKDNLTWTLLKPRCSKYHKLDASELESFSEVHSKLSIALEVMHECFEPFVESRTGRDLIGDVIFGRRSSLRRLNFRGFYTAILEKGDELITVATLRVHGEQVAEIPLIGTRFQFRRRGMCRVLLDVLEKELMELGVQRLVLPAVPSVLNTWTGSFGFSKMAESEKLRLANYTFLEFQETVMCCKPLINVVSANSSKSSEVPPRFCSDASTSNNSIDLDQSSDTNSDVLQSDSAKNGGILQQGLTSDIAGDFSSCSNNKSSLCLVVRPDVENVPPESKSGLECCAEDCTVRKDQPNNYDSTNVNKRCRVFGVKDLKYYKRRRFTGPT